MLEDRPGGRMKDILLCGLAFSGSILWGIAAPATEALHSKNITPANATLNDFCENPYSSICGDEGESESKREQKILIEKEILAQIATKAVLREVPETAYLLQISKEQLDLQKILALSQATDPFNKRVGERALRAYFRALTDQLENDLGASFYAAKLHFDSVRTYFLGAAVEKTKRIVPKVIPKAEIDDMLAHLHNAEFINAIDGFRGDLGDPNYEKELIDLCGKDGLADNAFAWQSDGKDYVVICPGDYVAELGPEDATLPLEKLPLAGSVWTLGHETGHLFDSDGHEQTYGKLQACMKESYSNGLSHHVTDYMREISGDYWGSEALAQYLHTLKSPREKLRALQESLEGICGEQMPDDGEHPNGRFRIENLVRRNPRIHEAACLEWKPKPGHAFGPTCTLRGNWDDRKERPARFW